MNDVARPTQPPLKVGGTVPEGSLYIERPEDDQVYALLKSGTYCNVLTSRQMGKSSLVKRVRERLVSEGGRDVLVDLSSLGGDKLKDPVAWYRSLMTEMAIKTKALPAFERWWKDRPAGEETMGTRFRAFVDEFLLKEATPIVVVFDEVDATRNLGFTDDLFLTIRFLHNDRAERPELKLLTFCIVGVVLADDLIKTATRTPYNIGTTVRLSDFTRDRCEPLVSYLNQKGLAGAPIVDKIFAWSSGQPYLTVALCDQVVLKKTTDVEALARAEIANPTAFKVHFGRIELIVRERVATSSRVRSRYLAMLDGKSVLGVPEADEDAMLLAGLVHRDETGKIRLRNRIYRLRFDRRWVDAVLPAPPTPRWVAVVLVLGALVMVGGVGAGIVSRTRARADAAEKIRRAAQEGAAGISKATSDEQATAIWKGLQAVGGAAIDTAVRDAAKEYWDNRQKELEDLAVAMAGAGCTEESEVLRGFASNRAGTPRPLTGAFEFVAATLWPPPPPRENTNDDEVARCLDRRQQSCDRLVRAEGSLNASCSGKLLSFSPLRALRVIPGSGSGLVSVGAGDSLSIGKVDDTLVVTFGTGNATLKVCPAQRTGSGTTTSSVSTLAVRTAAGAARVAFTCSDNTYAQISIPRIDAWIDDLKQGKSTAAHGGYGVNAIAWLGDSLLTATAVEERDESVVEINQRSGIRLPSVTTLASFAGDSPFAAFGTSGGKRPAEVGVLQWEGGRLVASHERPLTSCGGPLCVVRVVAAGVDVQHVAGLVVGVAAGGQPPAMQLVLVLNDGVKAFSIKDENPLDLAVADWEGQAVAALPLKGRIRLYGWEKQKNETDKESAWIEVQRRLGLTVRYGDVGNDQKHSVRRARIERLDEAGLQKVVRFADVFPE